MTKTKQRAVRLLHKYDKMRVELRALEAELQQACHEYGREQGYLGWFHRDTLRSMLLVEEEQRAKLEQQAERHAWEKAHG